MLNHLSSSNNMVYLRNWDSFVSESNKLFQASPVKVSLSILLTSPFVFIVLIHKLCGYPRPGIAPNGGTDWGSSSSR